MPVLGCLASVLALACGHPAAVPQAPPLLIPSPGPLIPSRTGRSKLLVIGDSLTQNTAGMLPPLLPGWQLGINGYGGRPLEEGLRILSGYQLPSDGSVILAMPLFTNDAPTKVRLLQAAVDESLRRVGPAGCVIWATIHRPAVNGHSYDRANRYLRRVAAADSRVRLIDWQRAVAQRHLRFDRTGVHPLKRDGGWHFRARLVARAARSC